MSELIEFRTEIAKVDEEQHLVFGWMYVCETPEGEQVIDNSGEYILAEDLEPAAYDYVMGSRAASLLHETFEDAEGNPIAECCESVFTSREKQTAMGLPDGALPVGWWVGFKIYDPAVWEGIKSGEIEAFSIGGSAVKDDPEEFAA